MYRILKKNDKHGLQIINDDINELFLWLILQRYIFKHFRGGKYVKQHIFKWEIKTKTKRCNDKVNLQVIVFMISLKCLKNPIMD